MNTDDFIAHVAAHAGIPFGGAERTTRAVLSGLGAYLTGGNRQFVADELPTPLAAAFATNDDWSVPIEERVLVPGMTAGHARELVASVCRTLAEELSTRARLLLRAAVPSGIATLLDAPSPEIAAAPLEPRRHDTLAAGRPGSFHPVSEAHPERGQSGSVADPNPHDATKLSSTPGTTQERQHETLAEGTPGYDHPLAGARR